jgi:hypothetical protein
MYVASQGNRKVLTACAKDIYRHAKMFLHPLGKELCLYTKHIRTDGIEKACSISLFRTLRGIRTHGKTHNYSGYAKGIVPGQANRAGGAWSEGL